MSLASRSLPELTVLSVVVTLTRSVPAGQNDWSTVLKSAKTSPASPACADPVCAFERPDSLFTVVVPESAVARQQRRTSETGRSMLRMYAFASAAVHVRVAKQCGSSLTAEHTTPLATPLMAERTLVAAASPFAPALSLTQAAAFAQVVRTARAAFVA